MRANLQCYFNFSLDLFMLCNSSHCITENCGRFDKFDNTNVNGATKVSDSSINTAEKCKTYCLGKSLAECSGFGFNRNNNECWIHDDDDDLNARMTNNNIDLYVRVCGNYGISHLCHIAKLCDAC